MKDNHEPTRMVMRLGFYLLLLPAFSSYAEPMQVRYEPNVVTVTGSISLVVFPGPPNYEDIQAGDTPQPVLMLELDTPLDVIGDEVAEGEDREGHFNATTYTNLHQLHLVDVNDHIQLAGTSEKRRVRAVGTLMAGHTGHHKADVVMFATLIEEIGLLK